MPSKYEPPKPHSSGRKAEARDAPSNIDTPALAGSPTVGGTLAVTMGNWNGEPTSYAYDWRKDGQSLGAPSQDRYMVTSAALGGMVDCEVTATNADGSASAVSNAIGPIVERPSGSPDGHTIVEEQIARSAVIEQMGVEAYKSDVMDDRPPEDKAQRQVPGVTPPTKRE
jgi:hypothetical protein